MITLVIGPSGVGKSTYGEHAAKVVPGCRFFDLDKLVSQRASICAPQLLGQIGHDKFLESCQREVDTITKSWVQGIAVVAVGAGAYDSEHFRSWLSRHVGPTIAVVAPPDEVYRRGGDRNRTRSLEEFTHAEYSSPRRKGLYQAAKHQCDVTGLTLDEAKVRFSHMVRDLLTRMDRSVVSS
jgi:shikimate kinase